MTHNSTSAGTSKGHNRPDQGGGNSPITLIAIIIGVIVIGAVAYKATQKGAPQTEAANTQAVQTDTSEPAKSKVVEPKDPTAGLSSAAATAPRPAAAAPEPKAPVTGPAKDLVDSLASIDPKKGPLTKDQIEKWKQDLKALIAQGKDAVPAIRQFLERNVELSYKTGGGDALGYSSLRASLIDALTQIGGPEATSALLATLQTTALPNEIQQLAAALNQLAPGQYTAETLAAARQTVELAINGSLGKEDIGPLFQMLSQDPNSVADLQKAANAYKYLPVIALGDMPNDAGVSALIQMSKDPNASSTVAVVLAEKALTNPEAAQALVDMASHLSPQAWQEVIGALGGKEYFIGNNPNQSNPAMRSTDCQYRHIEWNNQNFSVCPNPNFQPQQGVTTINKILAGVTDPNIRTVLQNQLNQLQGQK